jgi:hypothetical protein
VSSRTSRSTFFDSRLVVAIVLGYQSRTSIVSSQLTIQAHWGSSTLSMVKSALDTGTTVPSGMERIRTGRRPP